MNKTIIQVWVTIEAEMDDDSANVLGTSLCELVTEHLRSQQVPVLVVTAYAQHE